MANPIDPRLKTGTIGELLVQLRLLQYDIQAAPPIKDSGNDLIAMNGFTCVTIQVKTSTTGRFQKPGPDKRYHLLAIVDLQGHDNTINLDNSTIYLIPAEDVSGVSTAISSLTDYEMNQTRVAESIPYT